MRVIVKANGDVVIKRGKRGREPAVPFMTADELRSKIDLVKSRRLRQALAALADAVEGIRTPDSPSIIDLDDAWHAEENK